jgi:hypothetical protein
MAAMFTAADVAGLSTSVSAILITFIGIGLMFLARRYLGRVGIK